MVCGRIQSAGWKPRVQTQSSEVMESSTLPDGIADTLVWVREGRTDTPCWEHASLPPSWGSRTPATRPILLIPRMKLLSRGRSKTGRSRQDGE